MFSVDIVLIQKGNKTNKSLHAMDKSNRIQRQLCQTFSKQAAATFTSLIDDYFCITWLCQKMSLVPVLSPKPGTLVLSKLLGLMEAGPVFPTPAFKGQKFFNDNKW